MTAPSKKPILLRPEQEPEIVERVVAVLGKLQSDTDPELNLFCRYGALVRVLPNESPSAPPGSIEIQTIPKAVVRELIGAAVSLERPGKMEFGVLGPPRPASPPDWLVRSVAERGYWAGKIRALEGVTTAPTLRADGSILQTPGYDKATGLLYRPSQAYEPIPELPTTGQVCASVKSLLDVVADFPFEATPDRSAWLALVLSMIARPAVDGCVPLFAVTANIRGSGKSLLVDAASLIAYGHKAARQSFSIDREEQRKLITAVVVAASPCVLFDNLSVRLGGDALDGALTSQLWTDRILGESRSATLPMRTIFTATGNNICFGSDIARRVLPIRLASPEENPEERTDFYHPDLLGYVAGNRARLAVDALTIVRGYIAAGRPEQPGGAFGSFEAWSALIRGALVWAGLDDPLLTRETAKAQDDDSETLSLLVTALDESDTEGSGLTVKQLQRSADTEGASEALLALVGSHCPKGFNARTIGELFKKFRNRAFRGFRIEGKYGHARVMRWRAVRIDVDGGSGWCGGSLSTGTGGISRYEKVIAVETDPPDPPHPPLVGAELPIMASYSEDDFFEESGQ